jgi:Zn-dependent metalloprotease
MLDGLARSVGATQKQRDGALDALHTDASFRASRIGTLESRRPLLAVRRAARRARRLAAPFAQALGAQKRRAIFSAKNTQRLPGTLVRSEGSGLTGDQEVDEAYEFLGATWDLYFEQFDRNSLDGDGMQLNATVHYGKEYENAFWDGRRMVFGDGDRDPLNPPDPVDPDDIFEPFTRSIDVVGHELTHGVIEEEAGLVYFGQPGALNESLADVFGSLVKQYFLNQTAATADWLIGQELFIPGAVLGVALRSLAAPGTAYGDPIPDPLLGVDPQPDHMSGFVRTFQDNGGVHINSGIPNHAFYLVATKLGGNAWEAPGQIWYNTLLSPRLRRTAGFTTFARLTLITARQLFGAASPEQEAVREGWADVGVEI